MEKSTVFTQEIYTECEIDAPAHAVYSIISDFANYGGWTNEINVSGETHPGGNMRVHVKTAKNGSGWYKLKSKMERNSDQIIAFSNVLFARFLFLGRHRFEIIPLSNERTRFINAEGTLANVRRVLR